MESGDGVTTLDAVTAPIEPTRRDGRLKVIARRFDHQTWSGSLAIMLAITAALWVIEIINETDSHHLDRFGLKPRIVSGLEGIVTMPFLHANAGHLLANMFPFLIVGWVVLVGGTREFLLGTLMIMVLGGALTWVVGPSTTIVGASALVFGWLGYLVGRAVFTRRIVWILVAAGMLLFFGGLFTGLLPTSSHDYVAWQAHLCGFVAGVLAAWWLHPRKGDDRYLALRLGRKSAAGSDADS